MRRLARQLSAALVVVAISLACRTVLAEEFRVFTVVYDLSAKQKPGEKPPVVARAATLFHAGKVYDYVDAANEVIVLEPTERRFRVLNPARGLVATVAFDEIKTRLNIAREETRRHAATLTGSDPRSANAAASLAFQLDPRFEETFNPADGTLTLDGGPLAYMVRTADPKRPGVPSEYLDYADWVCQLNYLLHPGPVLPEPRMALNRSLRAKDRLPETVELKCVSGHAMHLRAEHAIYFDLNPQEEGWIYQWESQLKSESTRQVPMQEYQKIVLATRAR
ncbi:MAG: hypothetical protein M3552_06965 [Planctomycetota bacterium]|nr:hypothetical protein [Planctomycetaceae bacterium]MDQ3330377.1 hypothetical protein [Planctomycetota bacterium]